VGVVLALYGLAPIVTAPPDPLTLIGNVLTSSFTLVFGAVGALIVGRQPRNTIGWLLMIIALSLAVQSAVLAYQAQTGLPPTDPTAANILIAWYSSWGWWLLMGPLLLIPVLFPTGRPLTPRWNWVIASLIACFLFFLFLVSFAPELGVGDGLQTIHNPIGFLGESTDLLLVVFVALLVVNVGLCVSALFFRYRSAALIERQQIKWLLLACGFFLASFAFSAVFILTLPDQTAGPGIIFDLAVLAIPLAIGVAILRYRLFDINVIIRRTLVYSALSAVLALAYFGSVLVLQNVFQAVTGEGRSALVTVLSTLIIAALFGPLRSRAQRTIDRRFYRQKYDAARTLAAFGAQARDVVELEQLSEQLLAAVDQTMQPAHVGLWVRKPDGR